jgi:hypothetical protein
MTSLWAPGLSEWALNPSTLVGGGAVLSSRVPDCQELLATELHSALALKLRTGPLRAAEADRVLEGFERSFAPGLVWTWRQSCRRTAPLFIGTIDQQALSSGPGMAIPT